MIDTSEKQQSNPKNVLIIGLENIARASRFSFKNIQFKLPHTKNSTCNEALLTNQFDIESALDNSSSNLLQISPLCKLPHKQLNKNIGKYHSSLLNRVNLKQIKNNDLLRFKGRYNDSKSSKQKNFKAVMTSLGEEIGKARQELLKSIITSAIKSKSVQTKQSHGQARVRYLQNKFQQIKRNVFEIPMPKGHQISNTRYKRYKTLDDYTNNQLELSVNTGKSKPMNVDNIDSGFRTKCSHNISYSDQFYPRRNSTAVKFYRRSNVSNFASRDRRKQKRRSNFIKLDVTEMKLYDKQMQKKPITSSIHQPNDSKLFKADRNRSNSLGCQKHMPTQLTYQQANRYLSPWMNFVDDFQNF